MGITSASKTLSVSKINCGEPLNIQLSLSASPDILKNPTDIVLILDRSGSMKGAPLTNLKSGAKKFIQIIDESTDTKKDGNIGNGSRIAIVSFSSTAIKNTELITSVADLNAAVDSISAGGQTNHNDAFMRAFELLNDPSSTNQKVMLMFTDGITTVGGSPLAITTEAKNKGMIIYAAGISGITGFDTTPLNQWASSPSSAYVLVTPGTKELETAFENLAVNISIPGATNIVIQDTIAPEFRIVSAAAPTKGKTSILNDRTIQWSIPDLGTVGNEGASLSFTVLHMGRTPGVVRPNESLIYEDAETNAVDFPSPSLEILCNNPDPAYTEPCPEPTEIQIGGCSDTLTVNAGELLLSSTGRILEVNTVLKNVCPNKRVAVAAVLTETDAQNTEHPRGMKTFVVPAHTEATCKDILLSCIKFVLPEELNPNTAAASLCSERKFKVRFLSHYVDFDFDCCNMMF